MSAGDWVVHKGDQWGPKLRHAKRGGCRKEPTCRNDDGNWYCFNCDEVAPTEIQFAADLCNCKESLHKDACFYGPFTFLTSMDNGIVSMRKQSEFYKNFKTAINTSI